MNKMSENVLERHVREGDLSRSEAGYFCNVCSVPLGQQPIPHVQGAQHRNAIFFLTLSQPEKYHTRYRDLPQRTRTALDNKIIVAKERRVVCLICDVPLSKEKTVDDHLASSNHATKVANMSSKAVSPSPVSPRGAAPSPHPSGFAYDEPSNLGQVTPGSSAGLADTSVTDALKNGHIKMIETNGIDGFQCNVCENTKMITGDTPMRQHLDGRTHKKNALRHELRLHQPSDLAAQVQQLSPPSRNDEQFPVQRTSSVNQPQSPFYHQSLAHPQQNEFNYHQNSPHQVNQRLGERLDQQQYNIVNAFPSLTLNVSVGGLQSPPVPSYQHQTSRPENQNPQPPPPTGRNNFDPRATRGQPTSPYKIASSPRGIVVVFNYYFEGKGKNQRDGALQDYENLSEVFTNLGYEVLPQNVDLSKQQTLDKLDEVRSSHKLKEVDAFIAFFLSHGADSPDSFRTADEEVISVEEIIYSKFTDADCPQLRRKPKLLFFNFCRGKTNQLQNDSSWKPSSPDAVAVRDVAVIQATLPHFVAKRHKVNGTVFVECLCEVLGQSARTLDLYDIVLETSRLMQERDATTATPWTIDFHKFYFL